MKVNSCVYDIYTYVFRCRKIGIVAIPTAQGSAVANKPKNKLNYFYETQQQQKNLSFYVRRVDISRCEFFAIFYL